MNSWLQAVYYDSAKSGLIIYDPYYKIGYSIPDSSLIRSELSAFSGPAFQDNLLYGNQDILHFYVPTEWLYNI